jgi:hypothetical protein
MVSALLQAILVAALVVMIIGRPIPNPGAYAAPLLLTLLVVTAWSSVEWWRAMAPDPSVPDWDRPPFVRVLGRPSLVLRTPFPAFGLCFAAFERHSAFSDGLVWAAAIAMAVSLIAWIAAFYAIMLHTQWLAARVPDRALARRCDRLMVLIAPVCLTCGMPILGPIGCALAYLLTLDRLRNRIVACRADQRWNAAA